MSVSGAVDSVSMDALNSVDGNSENALPEHVRSAVDVINDPSATSQEKAKAYSTLVEYLETSSDLDSAVIEDVTAARNDAIQLAISEMLGVPVAELDSLDVSSLPPGKIAELHMLLSDMGLIKTDPSAVDSDGNQEAYSPDELANIVSSGSLYLQSGALSNMTSDISGALDGIGVDSLSDSFESQSLKFDELNAQIESMQIETDQDINSASSEQKQKLADMAFDLGLVDRAGADALRENPSLVFDYAAGATESEVFGDGNIPSSEELSELSITDIFAEMRLLDQQKIEAVVAGDPIKIMEINTKKQELQMKMQLLMSLI